MKSKFIKWEGDMFKVVETDSGFDTFKFVDNVWKRVSGKLTATLLFEGMPMDKRIDKKNLTNF